MKKSYKTPELRIIELETTTLLADSLLKDADSQDIKLKDEVLEGNGIWVY